MHVFLLRPFVMNYARLTVSRSVLHTSHHGRRGTRTRGTHGALHTRRCVRSQGEAWPEKGHRRLQKKREYASPSASRELRQAPAPAPAECRAATRGGSGCRRAATRTGRGERRATPPPSSARASAGPVHTPRCEETPFTASSSESVSARSAWSSTFCSASSSAHRTITEETSRHSNSSRKSRPAIV